ncbi:MAG: RNA-binding transcriptional accessory protein [Planctomycetes bacterium]|nr:RNA-binding transcriptional accessory protein [Planctomycetota bacterium]
MTDVTATPAIEAQLARELGVRAQQVEATVRLLDEGATVPFIARYRKEVTGGLDDVQLRTLEERLGYLRELEERRATVLRTIEEQGLLTPELRAAICAADTKTRLEDLYLPFKPKRRTKAQIARERGLGPLADALLQDPTLDPIAFAAQFVDAEREVPDVDAALDGARHVLIEQFAEDPELARVLRGHVERRAELRSRLADPSRELEGRKFRDWFDHAEPLRDVPSHRALAFLRGRRENILRIALRLTPDDDDLAADSTGTCVAKVCERFGIRAEGRPADGWLLDTARVAWRARIALRIETDLLAALRERAEEEAIRVFAGNLHDLLLQAPAGPRRILGLDPGLRTGVKVAVVDETGKVLATDTVYPTPPREDVEGTLERLAQLVREHDVTLISVGNGTGSRETDRCVVKLLQRLGGERRIEKVVTSEAGASVYSASEVASEELPGLDVSLRGAVSIARRLQDPLAELVKIEPKAIGVGQYQHDVDQGRLARSLGAVVEDCVNRVGVDVNTASPSLLAHVAGLTPTIARNIVARRDERGAFQRRAELLDVPRLGPKAFEQAAGFLRIRGGADPLDGSAVHPEAYDVVRRIEQRTGRPVATLVGDGAFLRSLDPREFADDRFGEPTVADILAELEKPGRDPRPEWTTATFQEGVEELADLKPGMVLEGVVSNVTNFGAFVDLGVHQDGLVHVSRISEDFVQDPRAVVRAGQVVKVKVLEVDLERQRIALTMRMGDEPGEAPRRGGERSARGERGGAERGAAQRGGRPERGGRDRGDRRGAPQRAQRDEPEPPSALAQAFAKFRKQGGSL